MFDKSGKAGEISVKLYLDKATTLRATYNFKTPDSIHLAAAIFSRCKTFLTHDTALKKCSEIRVELISDLIQT